MSDRQTQSYLSERFEQAGVRPKMKYGQNFLIDLNLVDLLARTADIGPSDVVLEVGTGAGSLTTKMAALAAHVVTVEIDGSLARVARRELEPFKNVTLLQMDALKTKNRMQDAVIAAIQEQVQAEPGRRFKLAANLPYNVATPIISNLLSIEPLAERMVVTIQKELAERITAKPRTKDYSALSIWMQSQCDCEIVRIMPPSVFWPRPKVDSAILLVRPNREKQSRIQNLEYFHETIRAIFCHRRKFLRSAILSAMKDKLDRTTVDAILANANYGPQARAEELSVEQLIDLVELFRAAQTSA